MDLIELTRRRFLQGSAATTVVLSGGSRLMFGAAPDPSPQAVTHDAVIYLFLRGGIDGLNLVVPTAGEDRVFYEQARPGLQIATSGAYGALPLTLASNAATGFGLHPSASGLRDIWNAGRLAIVHACGLRTTVTRSHFDAQLYAELGTPTLSSGTGWLARAFAQQSGINGAPFGAVAIGGGVPTSYLGSTDTLAMASPRDFALNQGNWDWRRGGESRPTGLRGVQETVADLWTQGSGPLAVAGRGATRALSTVAVQPFANRPASWPSSGLADQLWTIAQSVKFELGLHYATLDYGGWDTHDGQGTAGTGYHYYQNKVAELSQALTAFYTELSASGHIGRVTVVIQSEFGRRVRSNGSGGTDHGYGNPVLVLGGPVNGRRFYGQWPGLDPELLSDTFGDIPVTTDYRRVLTEILMRRMRNNAISQVFPGYTGHQALGLVQGTDMTLLGADGGVYDARPVAPGTPAPTPTPSPTPPPTAPVERPGLRRMIGLQR